MPYQRILLKLSGEALGSQLSGYSEERIASIVQSIQSIYEITSQIAIVVGGGNLLRGGRSKLSIPASSLDSVGMLATVMNGIILREMLEKVGLSAEVLAPFQATGSVKLYSERVACHLLTEGKIVIFSGGINAPFFTTDTAAAVRASEIKANLLIKASTVDGVYSSDPQKDPSAKRFSKLSFKEILEKRLSIMDGSALEICAKHKIPIAVVNFSDKNAVKKACLGENVGTIVGGELL